MSPPQLALPPPAREEKPRQSALAWLRNRFFTGIVVGAPIGVTIWLIWSFVSFIDSQVKPLIPPEWNPETYLKFSLPGLGIVVGVLGITILGVLAANIIGESILGFGERMVNRIPIMRSIYSALKQVMGVVGGGPDSSFKGVVMVEYPRQGSWALAFITNQTPGGEFSEKAPGHIAVFVPATPNPAMGALLYVPQDKVIPMKMSVEEAAKLIISAGIVSLDGLEPAQREAVQAERD